MEKPEKQSPSDIRAALNDAHELLLAIHKSLLDHERARYEKTHGPIPNAGAVLQLVVNDPWFGWLKPLSAMITQIDEVAADEPFNRDAAEAVLAESRRLLAPDENGTPFQRDYFRTIHESLDVAYLHGQWKQQNRKIP